MLVHHGIDQFALHAIRSTQLKPAVHVIEHIDRAGIGIGELHGLGGDGGEDSLQIERLVHRLRYVCEHAQLADRAAKLLASRPQFGQQPGIFNGDNRLVGEAAAAEYYRRVGIRSQLLVPLLVGGRVVATIGFGAFRSTRQWPDEFIARVRVIGEVMAQALVRKRSEAALRASEARWQSVFETSTIGISIFDRDLHYTETNPAFRTILGYTEEELRQLTPLDITAENDRQGAQARVAELLQGRVNRYTAVKQYRRKDGTVIWGHVSVARAPESEMFIGTLIDITESKQAQDKLQTMQMQLARVTSLTTVGQMAASMAHEIKQPLATIALGCSAGLRWLAKQPPDLEEVRADLDRIANASDRASQVIEGIRSMFKSDSRKRPFWTSTR
jgi:PAS domain S-box-containing protein